jgi:nicotinamidase-related amidase
MMVENNDVLQDIELAPESSALVVVDMENEFCKPDGKLYIGPEVNTMIDHVASLLKRCRDTGVPIIYVRSVRYPDDPDFTRFGRDYHLIDGTNGPVIVEELRPQPGEPVVEKHTHDCFHNTEMDNVLKQMGIGCETHQVIVTGVMSNVCVYHAVLGFHVRHYRTVLPIDCTIGSPGAEEFVVSQFSSRAYNYNITLTTYERLAFAVRAD